MSEFSGYEAAKMLVQLERIHCNFLSEIIESLGVFTSQHRILMYLNDRGEDCPSQKEIAETFNISPAAVAVSLRKLADKGYIHKKSFDNDNRVNKVYLTEKGIDVVETTMAEVKDASKQLFSVMTDEEIDGFCKCIIKISDAIKNYNK